MLKIQQAKTIKRYREITGTHTLPFTALTVAVEPFISRDANLRQRWDALWASRFDVNQLYVAGLDDDHIDSALKDICNRCYPAKELGIV
jgi:hypothetical protein